MLLQSHILRPVIFTKKNTSQSVYRWPYRSWHSELTTCWKKLGRKKKKSVWICYKCKRISKVHCRQFPLLLTSFSSHSKHSSRAGLQLPGLSCADFPERCQKLHGKLVGFSELLEALAQFSLSCFGAKTSLKCFPFPHTRNCVKLNLLTTLIVLLEPKFGFPVFH